MSINVFISFRYADGISYKEELVKILGESDRIIDFSEDEDRSGLSEDTIREYLYSKIRRTSVTIIIITPQAVNHRKNIYGYYDDWMHDEIRYSLEDRDSNRTSGLVAVYTNDAKDSLISIDNHTCDKCNKIQQVSRIIEVENLFRKNMMNVKKEYKKNKCDNLYDSRYDSYCQLVSYEDFKANPEKYISFAYEKKQKVERYELVKNLNKYGGL